MKKQSIIISIIIILVIAVGVYFISTAKPKPGANDELAQCLSDSGVKFYGAFWCPHCQNQKMLFGKKSAKLLPYVECSTPDAGNQTQVCIDNEIEGYPTWEFPKGLKITSNDAPTICGIKTGNDGVEDPSCQQNSSAYRTTWIFSNGLKVQSKETPAINSKVWTFKPNSRLSGSVPLQELSLQSSCLISKYDRNI